MEFYYNTSSRQMSLCYIMTIDASLADKVTVFAKEHPKNPGLSITNSVEYLIQEFEKLYSKKAIINYLDSEGVRTLAKLEEGRPVFGVKFE